MPRSRVLVCSGLVVAMAATAGCDRTHSPDPPAAATGSAASPQLPAVPDTAHEVANESIHYRCEGGFEVVVAGDTARVAVADGRGFSLARGSSPESMEFSGEAWTFSVARETAILVQDGGGRFPCTGVD